MFSCIQGASLCFHLPSQAQLSLWLRDKMKPVSLQRGHPWKALLYPKPRTASGNSAHFVGPVLALSSCTVQAIYDSWHDVTKMDSAPH